MRTPPSALWLRLTLAAAGLAAGFAALPARPAQACGGFFCNQSQDPNNLPVAQTAENVLFAMDRAPNGQFLLEAHVQIFYTGPADKFSWIVPVDSQPVVEVGSNTVFNALLGATQPRFELDWQDVGKCKQTAYPSPNAGSAPGLGIPGSGGSSSAADGPKGVDIAFRADVGPYDAAVLRSTNPQDAKPVIDWLNENGYFVTSEGARLLADYVRQEKYFVAIKLLPQKDIKEILPLVMRFAGPGPCIPLKLTAIAALKDLKINLWVLGDQRVVPDNVYEMEINPARIDWFSGGSNYDELVKRAADEAGGNAFITEYAGPTTMFKEQLYRPAGYNLAAIRAAKTPPDALDQIGQQSFPRDSSLLEVLRVQIPLPATLKAMGVDERSFYNGLRGYWDQYQAQFAPFDAGALATALDTRFIQPLRNVQQLIDNHPRLTRLSTFISPEEMTTDPTFTMNSSLPDVPVVRRAKAIRFCGNEEYDVCGAPVRLQLADGQSIWLIPQKQDYPCYGNAPGYQRGALDAMPALFRGWRRTSAGEGLAMLDNDSAIRKAVNAHNVALVGSSPTAIPPGLPINQPPPPPGTGVEGTSPSGGCSCTVGNLAAVPPLVLPVLFGLGTLLVRRRRR